jgi:putative FmdB family regulatory protein
LVKAEEGSDVVRYEYRCGQHGAFEVTLPMGDATAESPCPVCGISAVRAFSMPFTATSSRAAMAVIDQAEKSRYEPEVVTALPRRPLSQRTPMAPPTPALQRLPLP